LEGVAKGSLDFTKGSLEEEAEGVAKGSLDFAKGSVEDEKGSEEDANGSVLPVVENGSEEELKEKEDSLDELKQQLYDISNLTNKKEYEYKHVLQEKQHEMQNIQEELNQREQMIQNINIGLLKAKDEASNTYSDYTKQNNRLKIPLKQVQNAYEELFKKHTRVVKMYNKQLKQHDKTLEMVKNLKDVVEDQQQHIHRANVEYDEKEKKVRLEFKTRQEDMEAKEVEYKSTINELSLQKLNEITNMETKIKKIETEKHVLMSRIREITNNNIKSEGKCKEEKVKNNLLVERLKRADELIELEKEEIKHKVTENLNLESEI
jgi:chromosome segregation ATPase